MISTLRVCGAQLRRYREAASLTQEQLAERAGLIVNAISLLERGWCRLPYPRTIRKLAQVLSVPIQGSRSRPRIVNNELFDMVRFSVKSRQASRPYPRYVATAYKLIIQFEYAPLTSHGTSGRFRLQLSTILYLT